MTRFLRSIYRASKLPYVKRFIEQPAEKGLNKALNYKLRFSRGGDYLFVACMPKSGSTFMAKALSELTGYGYVNLAYAYERNEQTLYLPKLIDSYSSGSVTHLHVRATESTIDLMKMFSIKPVILVRNIFDIVVSIRDHMFQEGFEIHTFYCDKKFETLEEKSWYDFIIEHGIPWYFNFYVSWFEATAAKRLECLWLTYEDVISDWHRAIKRVADFYKIEKTHEEIAQALERTMKKKKQKIRLNKGIAGRGSQSLTEEQKKKIVKFARFYPWVDFSKIGIPNKQMNLTP
jgi:hypothetical protein